MFVKSSSAELSHLMFLMKQLHLFLRIKTMIGIP